MARPEYKSALIVGAGPGLSASFTRLCAHEGWTVSLASRTPDDLADICAQTGARAYACDATDVDAVGGLYAQLDKEGRTAAEPELNGLLAKNAEAYGLVELDRWLRRREEPLAENQRRGYSDDVLVRLLAEHSLPLQLLAELAGATSLGQQFDPDHQSFAADFFYERTGNLFQSLKEMFSHFS